MKNLNISPVYSLDKNLKAIRLSGSFTALDAINFKVKVLDIIKKQSSDFELNLENIEALDVTGLNALAMAHKRMKEKGCKLVVVTDSDGPAMEFLHLTKFSNYFHLKVA